MSQDPMPSIEEPIKDAEFHAYLDGELAASLVEAVEARLHVDIEARILMKSLMVQRDALQSKYRVLDDCPKTRAWMDAVLSSRR
jgi:anti-sigma factor RsiW